MTNPGLEPSDKQASHELLDELKDLNKTIKASSKATERYTVVLLLLAMIQVAIAFVPIGIMLVPDKYHAFAAGGWVIILIASVSYILKFGNQIFDERKLWEKDRTEN